MNSQTEEKRRRALQERRLERELRVEQSLCIWEKEILPDWKVVHRNPAMRRLWWNGIPTKLRATLWERAVGNALALSKGTNNGFTCSRQFIKRFIGQTLTEYALRVRNAFLKPGPSRQPHSIRSNKTYEVLSHHFTYFTRSRARCMENSRICYTHGSCLAQMRV